MTMLRMTFPALITIGLIAWPPATSVVHAEQEDQAAEKISVFGEQELVAPKAWKRVPVQSSIIEHEFEIKQGDGDDAPTARITLMPAGGDIKANIDRWRTQITGGDPADQKVQEEKIGQWTVHLVDLAGTFKERVGGGPFAGGRVVERPDYAMLGAILVHPEGRKYFIKMTGPAELVKTHREPLVQMLDGLK